MSRLLDDIQGPRDVRALSQKQLLQLGQEMREEILKVVSVNGGHLGPSLGVVELTLALHRVFDSPRDQIVWDVGHQAYGHKLLTGRLERFSTLRQYGGVSGFCRRAESPHDIFGAGHGGTSISAATGLALARDRMGDDYNVVAVIGDGSFTAGMAYEAMNHAGGLGTPLMVILNDNEMSISPNVGAMARYLTRITTAPVYRRLEADVYDLLGKIPRLGGKARTAAGRVKEGLKGLTVPSLLFEELGFKYFGPIDGHDLPGLIKTLGELKNFKEPVLLHILTKKGKGVTFAEQAPVKYHGLGPFDKVTGKTAPASAPSYSQEFASILVDLAEQDLRIVGITAAMLEGTGLKAFAERFPERTFDVGMAEQHAVTMAAGLAVNGMRPVCAIYSTFLQRAYDQVLHDVAIQNLPVIFAMDRAGFTGDDGPTHHGNFDIGFLRCIPNLSLLAPTDEQEFADMLYTATQGTGPVAIRYPRASVTGNGRKGFHALPWGKAAVLRKGGDVALWALGTGVALSMAAAELLAREGLEATVVNARFVKPLDEELLVQHARTLKRIVTVEEAALAGGFGSAVLEAMERNEVKGVEAKRLGIPDEFILHGRRDLLLRDVGLTPELIARRVLEWWPEHAAK